jgi:hypothetical protein
MKITTYGHAMLISVLAIFVLQFNGILWSLLGGVMIGTGLALARESGKEESI